MINSRYLGAIIIFICGLSSFVALGRNNVIAKWDFKDGIPAQKSMYPFYAANNHYSCVLGNATKP